MGAAGRSHEPENNLSGDSVVKLPADSRVTIRLSLPEITGVSADCPRIYRSFICVNKTWYFVHETGKPVSIIYSLIKC
jgi:hypothetical protein